VNLLVTAPLWAVWALILLLAIATVQDSAELRISNLLSGGVVILAVVAALVVGPKLSLWQNGVGLAVVLAIGTLMFARGWLGGGDVKLFAAITAWTAGLMSLRLVATIFLCGGALAILILVARAFAPESWGKKVRILRRREGIPYGVAITAGTLLLIALQR
jgi:prepilin peptidase CpaA